MSDNSEFMASVDKATTQIILQMVTNVEKGCLLLKRESIKNCPIDLGILRSSMVTDTSFNTEEIIGTIGNTQEYAPYVHQGTGIYAKNGDGRQTPWKYKAEAGKYKGWHITSGQKPQPFIEKARDDNKGTIEMILGGK